MEALATVSPMQRWGLRAPRSRLPDKNVRKLVYHRGMLLRNKKQKSQPTKGGVNGGLCSLRNEKSGGGQWLALVEGIMLEIVSCIGLGLCLGVTEGMPWLQASHPHSR